MIKMWKVEKIEKVDEYDPQTYTLFIDEESKLNNCSFCNAKNLKEGYFCAKHKTFSCWKCIASDTKELVLCKGVRALSPIFVQKNVDPNPCIFLPIHDVKIEKK